MFAVLIYWWIRRPSGGPNNLYVYEPQQNPGRGLRARKPPPPHRSKAVLLLWFILIVNGYPLSVVLWLIVHFIRVALLPSAGKELSLLLFTCAVFNLSAVLVVRVPFPFGIWGRMWNSIVSVFDHYLFIYFKYQVTLGFINFQRLIQTTVDTYGRIDCVINNAGTSKCNKWFFSI